MVYGYNFDVKILEIIRKDIKENIISLIKVCANFKLGNSKKLKRFAYFNKNVCLVV